jgi:mRNA interferase HigB
MLIRMSSLKTWFKEASKAIWTSPNVIKDEYPIASVLKAGRGVFNICVISTD